jgi:hypothetical protein
MSMCILERSALKHPSPPDALISTHTIVCSHLSHVQLLLLPLSSLLMVPRTETAYQLFCRARAS